MNDVNRGLESLLAFWADAGVETMLTLEPRDLTREGTASTARVPMPPARGPIVGGPSSDSLQPAEADPAAWALASSCTDIAALASVIARYDGCALKRAGARQAVFSRGQSPAKVMVVGEAPGEEEDLRGEPFVGRAGRLLDRMLGAAELADQVFITNTVFWRPPGNRTPTGEEQEQCRPFLERAIALTRPQVLLLVGGAAAKAILNPSEGILKIRGRWFDWRPSQGGEVLPVLPTLHPAFLLRQPAAKKLVWSDLLELKERLERIAPPA
jgi:DNA polymerase